MNEWLKLSHLKACLAPYFARIYNSSAEKNKIKFLFIYYNFMCVHAVCMVYVSTWCVCAYVCACACCAHAWCVGMVCVCVHDVCLCTCM